MIEFHEIHEESTEESKLQHVNDMYDEENDEELPELIPDSHLSTIPNIASRAAQPKPHC